MCSVSSVLTEWSPLKDVLLVLVRMIPDTLNRGRETQPAIQWSSSIFLAQLDKTREGKSGFKHATAVTRSCAWKTVTFVVYILSVEMVQQKRSLILYLPLLVTKGLLSHCLSCEVIFYTVPRCHGCIRNEGHLVSERQLKREASLV